MPGSGGGKIEKKKMQSQGFQILPYLVKYFKHAGALAGVWAVGYYHFSPSWVMLGLFFVMLNQEYKKMKMGKQEFAREASQIGEKEAILARIEELPSWVFFPDVERAEWLNKMVRQMWPFIGQYIENVLKTSVQPAVENAMPASLKPFKFEKIDLGDVAPRIGGVKVYTENLKRDQIIMDLEIFFTSDSEVKVAVRGLTAGIKDLTMHGHLRIVMKPLCNQMPIIGGMNIFFLNLPEIDFDLTNTANLLDMPLLSNTLRNVVVDQLANFLVLPNKYSLQLIQDLNVDELKYPLPQGVLRLHVVGARELKRADFKLVGKGKSDPYARIYVGAQSFKTKVIESTLTPMWNEYFEAVIDQKHGQFVEIECLDEDPGDDDELGTASLDISTVANKGSLDTWLPLENIETGMIHLRALWLHLSKDPADLDKEERLRAIRVEEESRLSRYRAMHENEKQIGHTSEEHLASALLMINVDSAKSLPRLLKYGLLRHKRSMSEPSPFVEVKLGNKMQQSAPKVKTTDPVWGENFQFLVNDPQHQTIQFQIIDSNSKNKKQLGRVDIPIKNILEAPDMLMNRSFPCKEAGPLSKLTLRLCLRVLTSELPADWARDDLCLGDAKDEAPSPDTADEKGEKENKEKEEAVPLSTAKIVAEDDNKAKEEPLKGITTKVVSAPPPRESPVDVGSTSDTKKPDFTIGDSADTQSIGSSVGDQPVLRQRIVTQSSSGSEENLGRIQLTIRFSAQRSKLIVVIHKCVGLGGYDDNNLSDPYVRIYLLPDTSSSSKRKTQVVKDNLSPIYDETFEWHLTLHEAPTRTLDIMVKNKNSMFSSARVNMGQVHIDLARMDLSKACTEWYDLQDLEGDH